MKYPGEEPDIDDYLQKSGVDDPISFRKITKESVNDPAVFLNIDSALAVLHRVLENGKGSLVRNRICIKVDPDVDGYTSSAYMIRFLTEASKYIKSPVTIQAVYSPGKEHGFTQQLYDAVTEHLQDLALIVLPDAGSGTMDAHRIEKLRAEGVFVPVLILDHHEPCEEIYACEKTYVVNCQDGQYPNRTLSGAGVVHQFVRAYRRKYMPDAKEDPLCVELTALGLIADVMDLRQYESRYFALQGLDHELGQGAHPFLAALEEYCEEGMKHGPTIMGYGWKVAPLINAVVRFGSLDEKRQLLEAMCALRDLKPVTRIPPRKSKHDPKPEPIMITGYQNMARMCNTIKERQDRTMRKAAKAVLEEKPVEAMEPHAFVWVDATNADWPNTLTGVLAGRLTSVYKRPVMVLRDTGNGMYAGSARGYVQTGIKDFKAFLDSFGHCFFLAGHDNAFGLQITKENLIQLQKDADATVPEEGISCHELVDYALQASQVNALLVQEFGGAYDIWGNGIPEPVFVIRDIPVKAEDIQEYSNGWMIKFKAGGITYCKKYNARGEYDRITLRDRNTFGTNTKQLLITVIGSFEIDMYQGNEYPQFRVRKWASREDDLFLF